jgi:uncharacterized membrane-anchored protein YitT (DUF2179 family)
MFLRRHFAAGVGALCSALSLEFCFIPYRMLDGGMTGLAVVLARVTGQNPVWVLILLNLTALCLGAVELGLVFVQTTCAALLVFGLTLWMVGPLPMFLTLPAAVLVGGLGVGMGLFLVLRGGGALDGCETLGILAHRRLGLPLVAFIVLFNLVVFTAASSLYSLSALLPSILAQGVGQLFLALAWKCKAS